MKHVPPQAGGTHLACRTRCSNGAALRTTTGARSQLGRIGNGANQPPELVRGQVSPRGDAPSIAVVGREAAPRKDLRAGGSNVKEPRADGGAGRPVM